MDNIPVKNKDVTNITVINKPKADGAFVDVFMMAITVVIFVAMIASYFVKIDPSATISVQEVTVEVVWMLAGTVSIGELIKRYSRNRGRNTEAYKQAEANAREKMKRLCDSPYRSRVEEYCENYTENTIKSYRRHQLSLVGITPEEYCERWLGKGTRELFQALKKKEISFDQFKAIRRCNRIKIKAYDPNFITSYNACFTMDKTPSEMYDAERADRINTINSLILATVSALFIGRMFVNVALNMTSAAVFSAIIKVIMILINVSFKASFGWKLSQMEMTRNLLRGDETEACIEWCKRNPVPTSEKSEQLAGNSDRLPNVTFTLFKGTGE